MLAWLSGARPGCKVAVGHHRSADGASNTKDIYRRTSGVGGMVLKWEIRSTWGKKVCSSATLSTTNPTVFYSGRAETLTRLRAEGPGFESGLSEGFSPSQKVQTACRAHSLILHGYRGCLYGVEWTGRDVQLRLMPRLGMSGAMPLLPLHAF